MDSVRDRSDLPVRLVVLNHDGGELTLRCLEHLQQLDWPSDRLEVVCIDNASTDGSPERIAERFPECALVRRTSNDGFGANNLGLTGLEGVRAVGLVNNDAFVESGWLRALVEVLESDPGLGAVCPKILLEPGFVPVRLEVAAGVPGRGDRREVGVRVRRVEVAGVDVTTSAKLGASGWGREVDRAGPFEWTRPAASLFVPAPETSGSFTVRLTLDAPVGALVTVDGGRGSLEHRVGSGPVEVEVDGPRVDVLNNIGSEILVDGHGVDRGWLQIDEGQFDEPVDVVAWCGGGVLLRPEFLEDVGMFDERFFLYYEDTDLSWRGRSRGWRYRTVPSARMRHVHSATTGAVSDLTLHLTERNRLVMLVRNASARLVVGQFVRHLLATASYARRDVVRRSVSGARPDPSTVRRRLAAYLAAISACRWALPSRRAIRRRRLLTDRVVMTGFTTRD